MEFEEKTREELLISRNLLRKEIDQLYKVMERVSDGIVAFDADFNYIYVNEKGAELLGRSVNELIGKNYWAEYPEAKGTPFANAYVKALKSQEPVIIEANYEHWNRWFVNRIYPSKEGITIFFSDITDQKIAEVKLYKTNRLYSLISHINQAIVHEKDRDRLLAEVCRIVVKFGEFRMAWIGLIDKERQVIIPTTFAGNEDGYLSAIPQITIGNEASGNGPSGRAVREGIPSVCSDYKKDPNVALWRDEALRRGYHSSISLPFSLFGNIEGVLNFYASSSDFFDKEEVDLLSGVASDLGYALETMEVQAKHELAVEALAKSEDRFRNIFNNLQDAFLQCDQLNKLTLVSPSAATMFGYHSAKEMIGLPVEELYANPVDRELMNVVLNKQKQVVDYIAMSKRKDGSAFWTSMSVYHQYLNGKIIGSEAVIRDISIRKTDEDKIKTFSSIVEQSPVSIVITDTNGNIEYVNPKFTTITGYSLEEAIGNNPRILKSASKTGEEYKDMWDTITSGEEWHGEFLNVKKSGESFYESASISAVFDGNGKITHYIAVKEDITERKKHEDQIKTLSTVVDQSPSMIIITDKSGTIEYVNAEFSRFTQYSSSEVIGRIPLIFNQKYHTSASYEKMWELINAGKPWLSEFKNRKKDGTVFWENIVAFPLVADGGDIKNYIIINEDITEKKLLLDDLVISKEKAEESDRLKSAFLANMSHEIRTPMNGILGFTELLKEPNLTGTEQQFYIQVIHESGNRMLNLMNNLIDISRIESGEVKITISPYDIKRKLDHLFDFFNQEAKSKGLRLIYRCNLQPGDTKIETDVQKLDSILENLVKNAIKFTRNGTIEFGCEKLGDQYRFFVKDSGTGIDPAHQEIIFDRFRQASESLSRPYEGAGLGLSISKAYVEILGGKIWVESEPGKGAVFYFTLPDCSKIEGKNSAQEIVPAEKILTFPGKLKLLLVEDDDVSMNYLEIITGKFCQEIYKASTGLEAVEIFRNNQDISIILMDIKLPVMDGLEATRQIRQFNKEVVILAQTAYSMVGDREKAIAAGCNDYISKPIEPLKLKNLVKLYAQPGKSV